MKKLIEEDGFKHFIFIGFQFEDLSRYIMGFPSNKGTTESVSYFKKSGVRFSILDSEVAAEQPNVKCPWCSNSLVQSISYRSDQNSYVAGCYAGLVSLTKKVACIQGNFFKKIIIIIYYNHHLPYICLMAH